MNDQNQGPSPCNHDVDKRSFRDTGQGAAPPELQQARELWAANRLNEALRMFERASRLYPEHFTCNLEAARAFAHRFEVAKAEELLHRLQARRPADPFEQLAIAKCYRTLGRLSQAIDCLHLALGTAPDFGQAHLELASIHDRLNQIAEGLAQVELCLKHCPQLPEALLCQSQLLRRIERFDHAETMLRQLVSHAANDTSVRIGAYYQLGYLLDELGRYDEAFHAVIQAKEIQLQDAFELHASSRREVAKLAELWQFTSSDLERWQQTSLPRERIAFLLGVPRSGTTLLERVLQSHPGVSSTDEAFILSDLIFPELLNNRDDRPLQIGDLNQWGTGRLKIDRDRYFRYVSAVLRQDVRKFLHVDKNPSLIRLLPAILRLFPEARILVALRDPRDLIVSCFMRQFPLNAVSVEYLTLEGTTDAVIRDLQLWDKLKQQLPSNWLEVHYETMVSDLESTARRTLDFLELDWDPAVLKFYQQTQPVNSPTYEDVAKPIYQEARGRWINYERHLAPVLKRLDAIKRPD